MNQPRNAILYNLPFTQTASAVNPPSVLVASVTQLLHRHEAVLQVLGSAGQWSLRVQENLVSLRLAEASLSKWGLISRLPAHPPQIAIIGPTQSGKSSVVNLLLGAGEAKVSPLAGYTVHPQGFPLNLGPALWDWLDDFFSGYQRLRPNQLPSDRYDCYGLADSLNQPGHPLPPSVLWDTPDFDSVDAGDYRLAVLRTAALADVLLLVVSKDKYADQSVWDTLRLLAPLAQPLLIVLNKIDLADRDTLTRSFQEKWHSARPDPCPPILVLPWVEELTEALPAALASELRSALTQVSQRVARQEYGSRARALLRAHWNDWLAPVREEWAIEAEWQTLVDDAVKDAVAIYQRDFLDHPHHYETFQRALAELLTLLEIPGLAGSMVAARNIITWPIRQLTRLGKNLRGKEELSQETTVLNRILEHLFIHLGQAVLDKGVAEQGLQGFWRDLGVSLRQERSLGELQRHAAILRHSQEFQPEIERTARKLHDKLKEQPAVLNALRATRVTTDAAALALALHTGGIGVQDFIIAPAILTITSLLTESALGHFLQKAEADLKEKQLAETRRLFDESIAPVLRNLPRRLNSEGRFNIPSQPLETVEVLLEG